jgi:iron complex transport system permease protein
VYWLMGSFAKASYDDLMLVIIPISVGMIILLFLRWRINILSLGDDEASSLGEKPERMRWLIIISVTIIAASAVTVAGIIGWVGLVIPHICRMIMGVDHKLLLPATILIGASFLAAIDIIARTATPAEIPIGILTAIIGAPFFALLLNRMKRGWI